MHLEWKIGTIAVCCIVFVLIFFLIHSMRLNPRADSQESPSEPNGVRYEMEEAEVIDENGASIPPYKMPDELASGGYIVGDTGANGYIFHNVPLSNRVWVTYASGHTSYISVYLLAGEEYQEIGRISFSTTQGWDMKTRWIAGSELLYIPEGSTIKLVPAMDVNMDYIELTASPLYTEEKLDPSISLAKGAAYPEGSLQDDMMAYVGQSVLLDQAGDAITWTAPESLSGQNNVVNLRYRAEQTVRISCEVNGGNAVEKTLPATSAHYYDINGLVSPIFQAGDRITVRLVEGSCYVDAATYGYLQESEVVTIPADAYGRGRREFCLDGVWLCDTTSFARRADDLPAEVPSSLNFLNSIPVPGLWDCASIALGDYEGKGLWYKKVVHLDAPPEGMVTLKIDRAYYGRFIYVNGRFVEEYPYNYTNSYTDITKYLRQGNNEIVILLGGIHQQLNDPDSPAHSGLDGEKTTYYPGLVDSVSLLFQDIPVVHAVQTVPNLQDGSVGVQAVLQNSSDAEAVTDVVYRVYELGVFQNGQASQEKKLVGTFTKTGVAVAAGESLTVPVQAISLEGFDKSRYWTPEQPFLYEIQVETSGDCYTARFGMRTFCFDPATKLPLLNGEPYYLRGTNVVINRFYEDESRGMHPWDPEWVRKLYQEAKDVHWNSFRMCIGPAAGFWYDLADEMGLMIMDEYAWWWCWCGCTTETLKPEITAWMDERCNHPSVIIWDMQNEDTTSKVSGQVIEMMRSYDLQNRPWDNGWAAPQSDTDTMECHPYLLSEFFLLRDLNHQSPFYENPPSHIPENFAPNNPKISNEYTSIWINRLGDPANPGIVSYYDLVLPGGSREDRIAHYAEATAQLTEFWRAGRHFAGLMQFCMLGYSKPTEQGCTSDILQPDLTTPQFQTVIQESYRNAFAPLGVILGDWSDTCVRGEIRDLPIILVNDFNRDIADLKVTVSIYKGKDDRSEAIYQKELTFQLKASGDSAGGDRVEQILRLQVPAYDTESYLLKASYTLDGETVSSKRIWNITGGDIQEPKMGNTILTGILWIVSGVLGAGLLSLGCVLLVRKNKNSKEEKK